MAGKYVSVLDFGSSKISVMIGEKGINNTFLIRGTGESEYAGFLNGEFVEPEKLAEVIMLCLTRAEANSGLTINKLVVGVPAEFSYNVCTNGSVAFNKKTKITETDVVSLFNSAGNEVNVKNNVVISRSAVHFILDDSRKCINPIGQVTTRLSGNVSFILAEERFISEIDAILHNTSISEVEYVSSVLAECLYLIEPEVRDTGAILIDVGYLTTFVAFTKGDGLVNLKAFSLGGGHISADLCEVLQLSFAEAENLKRKVVLSLQASDSDFYEVTVNGNVQPVSAKLTNEIVSARLDVIVELLNKCLYNLKGSNYVPIYLTGGGLCYLKGGKDYISKGIGENIEIVCGNVPQLNRPNYSGILSLLDLALKGEMTNKFSVWNKIKKWFKK